MTEEERELLVQEMRDEFQIPPYYDDMQLITLAKEGEAMVGGVKPRPEYSKRLNIQDACKKLYVLCNASQSERVYGKLFERYPYVANGNGGGL